MAVLEAGRIGGGASSVNAGMTIVGLKPSVEALWERLGPVATRELWEASVRSVDRVEALTVEEGIDCGFRRTGAAGLGRTETDLARLRDHAAWMRRHLGHELELLTGDEVREVVGSDLFRVAMVDDQSGGLHPARYVQGLARAARRAGAVLTDECEVTRLVRREGVFEVAADGRLIRADHLLVATNGYTGRLVPGLRRRVVPVGSYIIVTEPLDEATRGRLIPGGRMLWTWRNLLNYFRLTPDGRLLMGGRNSLRPGLDLTQSARRLWSTVEEFFPQLKGVAVTHSWSGRLGVTFDLMPHIGELDGVWYALGYSGHGVALATHLGEEVAGLMSGSLARSPFAELPHPTRWYYRRRAWFLPLAAMWYRLRDRSGL